MSTNSSDALDQVRSYYRKRESRWGYQLLLSGVRHYGYYPLDAPRISMREAQRNMEDVLGEALALPAGSQVLDAGCGAGSVARRLASRFGLRVDGVDLLDELVSLARERAEAEGLADRLSFFEGDFTHLPVSHERYDGVYTMEALIHAPDHEAALKEFHRILTPGGALVLVEYSKPQKSDLSAEEQQEFESISSKSGMHSFEKFIHGSFPAIVSGAGFEAISARDLTANILPMLKRFYQIAVVPYWVLDKLGWTDRLVNAQAAIAGYRQRDKFRYNLVVGRKPEFVSDAS